ncbi:MAG: hypothetical protein KME15_02665 [Drouetiella hepatica Uher 2000/2452]|jgi:hypothetical protein|uniref:Uncharacterized protein n=1 Tax=Drouetiella hepatica Uher 2000/2452 TaxID=904376 RepID=A0A951Q6K5_9CYAN|nr:hypothetical protein [Drouetiella hepatica Uher 2000/2452]
MGTRNRPIADAAAKREIEQFRQEMDHKLEHAIDHHEFKMVYIGIATLIAFAAAIYAAWKL